MELTAVPIVEPTHAEAPAELLERARELAAAEQAVTSLAAGRGGVLVIEAAAGLGKTAVLEHIAERAAAAGCLVRRAEPGPLERHFAYGVVRSLLERPLRDRSASEREELLEGAAELAGGLLLESRAPAAEAAAMLAHSVMWLCAALAEEQPMALVVDDAHWADRESLEVLGYLARRIEDVPLLIVVGTRTEDPEAANDLLSMLAEARSGGSWRLQPLSVIGGAQLIRRYAPETPLETCWRCHAAVGGNPWLLGEIGRQIAQHGIDSVWDQEEGMPVSAVAQTMVRRRLAGLDPEARSVAIALAMLGEHSAPHILAPLAGIAPEDLARARDALRAAGLLHPAAGRLAHGLIAAAIRDDLPGAERERLHREAADLLMRSDADSDVVAAHLLLCGPRGDARVSSLLQLAAKEALHRGAAHSAAAYLERALQERAERDDRGAMLAQLARATFDAGLPGFRERLRAALGEARDARSRSAVLTRLAALSVVDPADGEVAQLIETEIAREDDPAILLEVEVAALDALMVTPGRHAQRAVRASSIDVDAIAEPVLADAVRAHRAWLGSELGSPGAEACAAMALSALQHGQLLEESGVRAGYHMCARVLVMTDRQDEAEHAIAALADHAVAHGALRLRAAAAWYASELALRRGRVADAETHARMALDFVDDGMHLFTGGAIAVLVCALAERGACEEADEMLRRNGVDAELDESYWAVGIRFARARLRLAQGDYELALEEALAAGAAREAQGRPNPAWSAWQSTAALALAHLGRFDEAVALADAELARAVSFGAPVPIAAAAYARAVAEQDDAARVEHCRRALAGAGAVETLEAVRLQIELGRSLARLGARVKARDALRPALSRADEVGALLLADDARRELVASGLRPRRAATEGTAALTPRQRQVGRLAAAGKSNRSIAQELFVSVKTVETHLTVIYRTLGVSTRGEIGAALALD